MWKRAKDGQQKGPEAGACWEDDRWAEGQKMRSERQPGPALVEPDGSWRGLWILF